MNPLGPHVVYRCFDAADRLIYVGCTHDLKMRMRYHRHRTPWIAEMVRTESETFPNRALALRAKLVAIVMERPLHNKAYSHLQPLHVRAIKAIHHVEGEKPTGLPGQTALSAARSR